MEWFLVLGVSQKKDLKQIAKFFLDSLPKINLNGTYCFKVKLSVTGMTHETQNFIGEFMELI